MFEIASQMIICLLLAALIGFIIGYLLGENTCKDRYKHRTHEKHEEHTLHASGHSDNQPADTDTIAPATMSSPRNGKKDNLTRIKGIGVKIEEILNEKGIYHFDQIAAWTDENIKWVDTNVAFPGRVEREQWVEQAKILAKGEETEFSKRVDAGEVSSSKPI